MCGAPVNDWLVGNSANSQETAHVATPLIA